MSYKPKFSDPRVQRRIRRAIGFACGCLSTTKPQRWSTRYIDKWLGVQSNSLSSYLREQLLIVTDDRWSKDTGVCKEYLLNQTGVDYLSEILGLRSKDDNKQQHNLYPIVLQVAHEEYKKELDSGDFTYNDQSSRLWHPLQNFKRDAKRDVLENSGYKHHYDIECCAFTLIHQYSQQLPEPMDLYLKYLINYIHDRKRIRAEIAQAAEVPEDVIKRIINALLAGAKLSKNPTTQIYQILQGDIARIEFLKQHEFVGHLRQDIKVCWDYIKPTLPRRSKTQKNGRERMIPISSKQKWSVYFDLERQVLNEIREFLRETNNKHFLEHDGWSCESEIDLDVLTQRVYEKTGFKIELEKK